MRWAHGALARVVVDLLYETGGGPDGPGVTINQIVARVMARPPAGLLYTAIMEYGQLYTRGHLRRSARIQLADVLIDDGAQGVTILNNPETEQPWFTKRQAARRFLLKYLNGRNTQSAWLTRDGDLWRLVSAEKGPKVPGIGIYNAEARARFDEIDQGHAAYVTAKAVVERIDGDVRFAGALVRGVLPRDNREAYHKRRKDYNAMLRAFPKLDPGQKREILMALAERSTKPNDNEG